MKEWSLTELIVNLLRLFTAVQNISSVPSTLPNHCVLRYLTGGITLLTFSHTQFKTGGHQNECENGLCQWRYWSLIILWIKTEMRNTLGAIDIAARCLYGEELSRKTWQIRWRNYCCLWNWYMVYIIHAKKISPIMSPSAVIASVVLVFLANIFFIHGALEVVAVLGKAMVASAMISCLFQTQFNYCYCVRADLHRPSLAYRCLLVSI